MSLLPYTARPVRGKRGCMLAVPVKAAYRYVDALRIVWGWHVDA